MGVPLCRGDGKCAEAIEEIGVAGGVEWQKWRECLLAVEKMGMAWVNRRARRRLGVRRAGWRATITRDVTIGDNSSSRVYCKAFRIGGQRIEGKGLKRVRNSEGRTLIAEREIID
jgi:hypothetical protein